MGCLKRLGDALVARPLFLVALSSLGFATQALFVKLLTRSGDFGSFEVVLVRGIGQATGVVVVLSSWREPVLRWLGVGRTERALLFLRGTFGFGGIAFGFLAIQMTTLANSQVAAQVTPVFSAVLSRIILGDPWLCREKLSALGAIVGVCLVLHPPFIFGSSKHMTYNDFMGIILSVIGSFCASCAYIAIRYMGTSVKVPWPKLMLAQAVAQILFSVPSLYASGQEWVMPTTRQMAYLGSCALLGFTSQVCMTIGMQRSKPAVASIMRQTGVLYAFLYQLLLVPGEHILDSTYIGAVVIVISIGGLGLCQLKQAQSTQSSQVEMQRASPRARLKAKNYELTPTHDDDFDETENPLKVSWDTPRGGVRLQAVRSTLLRMVPSSKTYEKIAGGWSGDTTIDFDSPPEDEGDTDSDDETSYMGV